MTGLFRKTSILNCIWPTKCWNICYCTFRCILDFSCSQSQFNITIRWILSINSIHKCIVKNFIYIWQVYTFGPTFRAENSNTSRHLAEFWVFSDPCNLNAYLKCITGMNLYKVAICSYNCWSLWSKMIEPELAFANLDDDMACATAYLQYVVCFFQFLSTDSTSFLVLSRFLNILSNFHFWTRINFIMLAR